MSRPKIKNLSKTSSWLKPGEVLPESAKEGNLGGQMLFRHRPEAYKAVVQDLAAGRTIKSICETYKVSPDVVVAIRRREGVSITEIKSLMADKMALASQAATEQLTEAIVSGDMKAHNLPFAVAVTTDKALVLGGEATSRVEHVQGPTVGEFAEVLDALDVTPPKDD